MATKILIVEDEESLAEAYSLTLEFFFEDENKSVEIVLAHNLSDALALADQGNWFAAIVDGNLTKEISGDDGRKVTEALVNSSPDIIIFGVSGQNYRDPEFWAKHGLFFKKPCDMEVILSELKKKLAQNL